MSLAKKGLSDSKYYLIANVGNKALAFLIIPILAKTVGVEQFAIYDIFLITSGIINIVIILGIDSGIAILLAESKNNDTLLSFFYLSTLLISTAILFFISIILMVILSYTDKFFLLNREVWGYIVLYELFVMINYHTFNFLRWRERAKEASFVTLFSYMLGMLVGLYFLYMVEPTVESYLQGLVIGLFLGALISLYISRAYILNFKVIDNAKQLLKELFKLSLPFVPSYLANSFVQMADRVVILALFGQHELGLYALVSKLANIPQILLGTVTGGFMPVMLGNYSTPKGQHLIKNFFHIYLLLIPVAFLIAYPLSDMAIEFFGGAEYAEGSYLLPMMLVSILFINTTQANGFGYLIERKTHYIIYISFLAVAVNYMASFIFGYYLGLWGVILGTLVTGIFITYLYTYYSEKFYRFNYSFSLITVITIVSLILVIFNGKGAV